MITAGDTVICQIGTSSMLVLTNTPSVAVKRAGRNSTPLVSEHGGRSDSRFLSSDIDRIRDVISPTKRNEENGIGCDCGSEERGNHKCGKRCKRDRECAGKDKIGRVGGHENRRA